MRWRGWGSARVVALIGLALAGVASSVEAARIFGAFWRNTSPTLQQLYQEGVSGPANTANVDTQLRADQATTNFGTTATLTVGVTNVSTAKKFHSILVFDLSGLGAVTVTACTLTVNLDSASIAPTASHFYRVCTEHWDTTNSEGQATWNIWKTANNWGTAGAINTGACAGGGDIDTSVGKALTVIPTGNEANNTAFTFEDITTMCQDAITSRVGLLRLWWGQDSEATIDNNIQFTSSDGGTAAQRPKLTVNYR